MNIIINYYSDWYLGIFRHGQLSHHPHSMKSHIFLTSNQTPNQGFYIDRANDKFHTSDLTWLLIGELGLIPQIGHPHKIRIMTSH